MKKSLFILAAASIAIAFSGCASNKAVEKSADKVPVVIGAEGVPRPMWVLSGMESDDGIYAVGNGKMSTKANSLKVAQTNGRAELSRTVQSTLKSVITTYAEDSNVPDDTLNYMEEATVLRTTQILSGSKQTDYWVDADNTVYVLMYLPYKAVTPAANDIITEYSVDKKTVITEEKVAAAMKKYNLLGNSAADAE